MTKKNTFLDSPEWTEIVNNIRGIMTSDGTMSTLLDFERVIDESDVYAFKNWELGELVDGPRIKRYVVICTFMFPTGIMPDPRAAKRLTVLGCKVQFKKTTIKVPIEIKEPDDFKAGTHYPKLIDRKVWLVNIVMPRDLMDDIREGSIDLAGQTIDLDDLDDAYSKDYDSEMSTGEEGGDEEAGDEEGGDELGGLPGL
jgi:hypothetical protein